MNHPIVFVSYARETLEHKDWVLMFSEKLRVSGVDVIFDQWDLKLGDDLPSFMESSIVRADKVLMICSENYARKANGGIGGVGYEKMILTTEYLNQIDSKKIIPVIRQLSTPYDVPIFAKSKLYIDFSNSENFESSLEELLRHIHNAPRNEKPAIGEVPLFFGSNPKIKFTSEETSKNVTRFLVFLFHDHVNTGESHISLYKLKRDQSLGTLLDATLPYCIEFCKGNGLVEESFFSNLKLSEEGIKFIQNSPIAQAVLQSGSMNSKTWLKPRKLSRAQESERAAAK
jgi:hypothetical protein